MDRLEQLMCRRVAYVMTDEPYTTYKGTVERETATGARTYRTRTKPG